MNSISLSSNKNKASTLLNTTISPSALVGIVIACITFIATFAGVVLSMRNGIRGTIASARTFMSRNYMENIEHEVSDIQHMTDVSLVVGIVLIFLFAVGSSFFFARASKSVVLKSIYVFAVLAVMLVFSAFFLYFPARFNELESHLTEPFCIGYGCQGKDPEGTNCESDAKSLSRVPGRVNNEVIRGKLELKYSKFCRANWVVWKRESSQPIPASPEVWMKDELRGVVGIADKFKGPSSEGYVWSGMISAKGDSCMALRLYASSGSSGESSKVYEVCTADMSG